MVYHGAAAGDAKPGNFDLLKLTLAETSRILLQRFPKALLLPTIGNNDVRNHY